MDQHDYVEPVSKEQKDNVSYDYTWVYVLATAVAVAGAYYYKTQMKK